MTWKRTVKSVVIASAVVSGLGASAFGMVRGQVPAILDRSDDLKTSAVVRLAWIEGLHDIRRLYVAARRELAEHVEYLVDTVARRR